MNTAKIVSKEINVRNLPLFIVLFATFCVIISSGKWLCSFPNNYYGMAIQNGQTIVEISENKGNNRIVEVYIQASTCSCYSSYWI